jgi:hypothetical protein
MGVSGQRHVPVALYPGEWTPSTHWIGGWVSFRAGLDTEARAEVPKLWGALRRRGAVGPQGVEEFIVWGTYYFELNMETR